MKRAALVGMVILVCGSAAFGQWIEQQSNLQAGAFATSFAVVNTGVVWASGYTYSTSERGGGWFCRTLDGGATWSAAVAPVPAKSYIVNITAVSADLAWIGVNNNPGTANNGVFKTSDGGKTWSRQSSGFAEVTTPLGFIYFFDANDGVVAFNQDTTGYSPIFYTRDGGETWTRVADADNVPMLPGETGFNNNFCAAGEFLYWGVMGNPTTGRLFWSSDRGKSWKAMTTPPPAGPWEAWYVYPAFKDSLNGMVVHSNGDGIGIALQVTHDGGATWLPATMPEITIVGCAPIPGIDKGYLTAGFGSAYTLDDGVTWTTIDDNMAYLPYLASGTTGWTGIWQSQGIRKWHIGQAPAIGCFPVAALNFSPLFPGQESAQQNLSITNYGLDPLVITGIELSGTSFRLNDLFSLPKTLQYLETARMSVTFTPKAGGVVHDSLVFVSNAQLSPHHAIQLHGEGIAINPTLSNCLYAVTAKSLYSLDPASGAGTKIADMTFNKISGLTVNPRSRELLGISTASDKTEFHLISASSGKTGLLGTLPLGSMRALAFKADTLYSATTGGELYRIDLAAGTAVLAGKAPGITYYGLAVHPATGELYASASGSTKDMIVKINPANGDTTLVGRTGENALIIALHFSPDGLLYGLKREVAITLINIDPATAKSTNVGPTGVSGLTGLAWSPKVTGVDQYAFAAGPVQKFTLQQSYPNPFNAQTCVEVTAARPEQVEVMIYNILGEPVATLHHGLLQAGKHTLVWTGKSDAEVQVSSGIYMIRMTAPGFLASRKVLLLR